jgi:hypothetical protein
MHPVETPVSTMMMQILTTWFIFLSFLRVDRCVNGILTAPSQPARWANVHIHRHQRWQAAPKSKNPKII